MAILPGWNSLEGAPKIAYWLHILAIIVLGLLVAAEGLALVYDGREKTLIAVAESGSATKRQLEQHQKDERRQAETTDQKTKVSEAEQTLTKLRENNLLVIFLLIKRRSSRLLCLPLEVRE